MAEKKYRISDCRMQSASECRTQSADTWIHAMSFLHAELDMRVVKQVSRQWHAWAKQSDARRTSIVLDWTATVRASLQHIPPWQRVERLVLLLPCKLDMARGWSKSSIDALATWLRALPRLSHLEFEHATRRHVVEGDESTDRSAVRNLLRWSSATTTLRTLILKNVHVGDLSWILSHAPTLVYLSLNDCSGGGGNDPWWEEEDNVVFPRLETLLITMARTNGIAQLPDHPVKRFPKLRHLRLAHINPVLDIEAHLLAKHWLFFYRHLSRIEIDTYEDDKSWLVLDREAKKLWLKMVHSTLMLDLVHTLLRDDTTAWKTVDWRSKFVEVDRLLMELPRTFSHVTHWIYPESLPWWRPELFNKQLLPSLTHLSIHTTLDLDGTLDSLVKCVPGHCVGGHCVGPSRVPYTADNVGGQPWPWTLFIRVKVDLSPDDQIPTLPKQLTVGAPECNISELGFCQRAACTRVEEYDPEQPTGIV